MPRKKKEKDKPTEVEQWLQKIERAKKVKESWREQFRVALGYEYRDGKQRPPNVSQDEWITINKVYSNLLAELPTLYSTDPYFYIKLAKSYNPHPMAIAMYEQKAKVRQSMLNYLKRELELKPKVRVSILDAFFQYGVAKIHYSADMIENPQAGEPITDDRGDMIFDEGGEYLKEPDRIPANEAYVISRLHPDDFIWDEDAGPLPEDWNWVAHRAKESIEDFKENKRFKKSVRSTVKATEIKDQYDKEREQRKKGTAYAYAEATIEPDVVVYWEIYDLKNDKWLVVSEGADDFLIDPDTLPKGTEKHTFAILRFFLRDDSPYPIPPVSQWLDPQKEFCELRSKIMTHRKRFNRKYEMWDEAFVDPDDSAVKLEVGGEGTILRKQQPGQAVLPIADAPLDQNHIQEIIMFRGDFEELAVGGNQRGLGAGVDSATEAGIIEKRTVLREGDKLGSVMDFVTDIGRKLDQLVQANITQDQAVKITGPEGEIWELIRTGDYEEIEGEYEYTVNVGATTPQLPEIERAQWMAFLGLIANAPQLALSKNLLKRMAELHHIEDDAMVDELHNIAKQMMGGQMPTPGRQGSLPNTADAMTRPASVSGGMAAGINNIRGGA